MNENEKAKCHFIIHTATAAAAGGSAVPIPGLDVGADIAAMTTMAIGLASVFGQDLTAAAARGIAYGALKKLIMKQPAKYAVKSFAKFIPGIGTFVSAAISVALTEAAGWQLAEEFSTKRLAA